MRVKFATAIAVLLPLLVPLFAPGHALAADPSSPAGLWQAIDDDTKQPTGWFLISEHDGIYTGIIAKMFLKPGESPNAVCDQCKDDRHNHPWLGLEFIRGMRQEEEDKYGGGTILDPRDGKIYKATMKVTPDGQTLVVRGYIGIEMLGQNQYWTRLPDSAYSTLDPAVNPNPAINPATSPKPGSVKPHKSELVPKPQAAARP
jgi:uncharacterized protein (DUF2147 family)